MATKQKVQKYYESVGRRREAVVRARLYMVTGSGGVKVGETSIKKGEIFVNKKPFQEVFTLISQRNKLMRVLETVDSADRFAISLFTVGGGNNGQLDASILAVARALEIADESFRPALKKEGFLTRDPRVRERRKPGTGGKARRAKQSPKR